jgi:(p)ppGpp synthase/HD superfamily hydrolase
MAIKFAAKTHNHYQQQVRKGKDIPYITHPLTVGIILTGINASEDVVVAGILHDTIEDSIDEKKVTPKMLTERFGKNVSDLVMSVTEVDKSMSWADRKREAIEHIKHFSNDSVLIKSADIISNVSELLDDYERYGDEVFERFKASKEDTIKNILKTTNTIIAKWSKNILIKDLKSLLVGDINIKDIEAVSPILNIKKIYPPFPSQLLVSVFQQKGIAFHHS